MRQADLVAEKVLLEAKKRHEVEMKNVHIELDRARNLELEKHLVLKMALKEVHRELEGHGRCGAIRDGEDEGDRTTSTNASTATSVTYVQYVE
jgi:hypothetical protein